jgi:hypothetical protein
MNIIMNRFFLLIASVAMATTMFAQSSRECIKQVIREKDECKSVAITQYNGDAMIYGHNGWAAQACPNDFTEALYELNTQKVEIQDIHITELGRWAILCNQHDVIYDLSYDNLKHKIATCQEDNEQITTITFNDAGDWILITTKQISASSDELMGWITDGCDKYGQVWTACITDDAAIVVYESGFKYYGNIPENLKEALRACESDVYTIKLSGQSWFFRCTDGSGRYHM